MFSTNGGVEKNAALRTRWGRAHASREHCKAGIFVSWWQCVSRNEVAGSLAEGEDLAKFAQLDGKATTANTNVPHAECSDPY